MNKQLYIILLLVISLFIVSCGKEEISTGETEISNSGSALEEYIEEEGVVVDSGSSSEINGSFPDIIQ